MKSAKRRVAAHFLHTLLLENEAPTSEKNTGLLFSKKLKATCKSSAHLNEKNKNRPKFDIERLCSDVFNCVKLYEPVKGNNFV